MTMLRVSKRGTIILPPELCRKLGLDRIDQPMVLVEECEGGIFLQTAVPVLLRDFTKTQMEQWIKGDKAGLTKLKTRKH